MKTRHVLFVDDDEKLLASVARVVADEPYEVWFAKSGQEAIDICKQTPVHVIIADILMPGMDGLKLLQMMKQQHPYAVRLVLSGDGEMNTLLVAINEVGVLRFIPKPWKSNEELRAAIRRALQLYDLQMGERCLCVSRHEAPHGSA